MIASAPGSLHSPSDGRRQWRAAASFAAACLLRCVFWAAEHAPHFLGHTSMCWVHAHARTLTCLRWCSHPPVFAAAPPSAMMPRAPALGAATRPSDTPWRALPHCAGHAHLPAEASVAIRFACRCPRERWRASGRSPDQSPLLSVWMHGRQLIGPDVALNPRSLVRLVGALRWGRLHLSHLLFP